MSVDKLKAKVAGLRFVSWQRISVPNKIDNCLKFKSNSQVHIKFQIRTHNPFHAHVYDTVQYG